MDVHACCLLEKLALAALASWPAAVPAEVVDVLVQDNAFQPATVNIKVGDSVRWTWLGQPHSSTSGTGCRPDGRWDSGLQNLGFTLTLAFPKAGTFSYFCSAHCTSGMTGTVVVATPPPPTTPPTAPPPAPESCSETNPINADPVPTAIARDPAPLAALKVLVGAGQGLVAPNFGTAAPGDKQHLFVADAIGKLWAIKLDDGSKHLVLDVSSLLVPDLGLAVTGAPGYDERGLLGVAFHPKYRHNGLFYTFTSEPVDPEVQADFPLRHLQVGHSPDHRDVVSEWRIADPRADQPTVTGARRVLMRVDHPELNHNGGALQFGPDGFLYIALGDGGQANDQDAIGGHAPAIGNGQDRATVLGKILRIDPRATGQRQYRIPRSNPFAGGGRRGGDAGCADGTCDELWAYGFRNPFRFSFDPATGRLWVGDVGQNKIEEVDWVRKGGNYGWRYKEGRFFFLPNGSDGSGVGFVSDRNCLGVPTQGLLDPVAEYDHDEGTAIVGGFVYRGKTIPALRAHYVFGDFTGKPGSAAPGGRLFHLDTRKLRAGRTGPLAITELHLAGEGPGMAVFGFARDAAGELYVLGNTSGVPAPRDSQGRYLDTGAIKKLVPLPKAAAAPRVR